jgi:hypothetical protein
LGFLSDLLKVNPSVETSLTVSNELGSNLNCLYSNATSLNSEKLSLLQLQLFDKDIHVCFISETWWTSTSIRVIEGYSVYYRDRISKIGGGVCIYVRNDLVSHVVSNNELGKFENSEQVYCVVQVGNERILCGCIYRPPVNESVCQSNDLEIHDALTFASKAKYNGIIICGDFNHSKVSWTIDGMPFLDSNPGKTEVVKKFAETLEDLKLVQVVSAPTFIKNLKSKNILDLVFAESSERIQFVEHVAPLILEKQGHHVLRFCYRSTGNYRQPSKQVLNYRKGDYQKFKEYLNLFQDKWVDIFDGKNVNEQVDAFMKILSDGIDRFIPLRTSRLSNNPRFQSKELKSLLNRSKRLWRRIKCSKNLEINSDLKLQYSEINKKIRSRLKTDKTSFENKFADLVTKDPGQVFRHIKKLTRERSGINAIIDEENNLITVPHRVAEVLDRHFANVFSKEDMSNFPEIEVSQTINICPDLIFDPIDIEARLKRINVNKSMGPDKLHPYVLKMLALELSEPLARIYQKSLDTGIVPAIWKLANVTPLYKNNGNRLVRSNYRQISLLSLLAKLIEGIISDHMKIFLSKENIISSHQHGFFAGRSTTSNLIEFIDVVSSALNDGSGVDVAFLDVAKAFDRVPWERLKLRLWFYGFRGKLYDWVCDYLFNRMQRLLVGDYVGSWHSIVSGVPQGSVLGPLLFIIYVNELLQILPMVKGYADDMQVISVNNSPEAKIVFQESLNQVYQWTVKWQLHLNIDKCKIMHFGSFKQLENRHQYCINGVPLLTTESEESLGVTITPKLDFHDHIAKKCAAARFKMKQTMNCFTKKSIFLIGRIYKSVVRPCLEYASAIWNPSSSVQIQLLEKTQRYATRFGKLATLDYSERYKILNLKSLEFRRIKSDLMKFYRFIHGNEHFQLSNFCKFKDKRTRGSHRIYGDLATHVVRRNFFTYRVLQVWNALPWIVMQNIKSELDFESYLDSLDSFSKFVKNTA